MMSLQDHQFELSRRVHHHHLHEETVELGLGQLIGALLLHGILRGNDSKQVAHGIGGAIDGGLPLLHHLEERCLSLGWGTVDLVDKHKVGKDRTFVEHKLGILLVEDGGAQHIAGHEVGCELEPAEPCVDEPGHHFGQQGLGHSRNALEEHMSVGHHSSEQQVDRIGLSHHHRTDFLSHE